MNSSTDYYTLLGVDRDASPTKIKAAFKKQALKYHPDVYKGEDAHERMRQLLHAYQTLSNTETRQSYDADLSSPRESGIVRETRSGTPRATSGTRNKDGRYYTSPTFHDGQPLHIDLGDISYTLRANEARTLVYQGMLRGVEPEVEQQRYFCHRCHYTWQPTKTKERVERWDVPRSCPQCEAGDWPEYLLLRCSHCRAIFESEQIRYEIGSYSYGRQTETALRALCPPYELFPLCPNCRRSHWCPAEEERVENLRRHAEQKTMILRMTFIGAAVLLIIVGAVLLSGFR